MILVIGFMNGCSDGTDDQSNQTNYSQGNNDQNNEVNHNQDNTNDSKNHVKSDQGPLVN